MRARSLLLLAVLISACSGRTMTLGKAPDLKLTLDPIAPTGGPPTAFEVIFFYDPTDGCIAFSGSARATVNGAEVPFVPPPQESPGPFLPACMFPAFRFPLELVNQQDTTIALEDGPDRSAVVIRDLMGPLALTVTPPAGGVIRAGSTIGLDWSPAGDDLSQLSGTFTSAARMDNTRSTATLAMSTFQGGHAPFTVPADAPTGTASIEFTNRRQPQVVSCEGASSCDAGYPLFPGQPNPFGAVSATLQIEP